MFVSPNFLARSSVLCTALHKLFEKSIAEAADLLDDSKQIFSILVYLSISEAVLLHLGTVFEGKGNETYLKNRS